MYLFANHTRNMQQIIALVVISALLPVFTFGTLDPCHDYKWLNDSTRAVSYESQPGATEQCDRNLKENWYRYKNDFNDNMPTFCPDIGKCGTTLPIWINDTLPRASSGLVTVKACQRSFVSCCDSEFPISVKHCGAFTVYRLTPTQGCPGRYCFNASSKCTDRTSSGTGFPLCQDNYPTFNATVKVMPTLPSTDVDNPNENQLHFQCSVSTIDSYKKNVFDVEWIIDDRSITTKTDIPYSTYQKDSRLSRDTWMNQTISLGFKVRCRVRMRDAVGSTPSAWVESDSFYAGVTLSKTTLTVAGGQQAQIQLRLTVPVACKTQNQRRLPCSFSFEIYDIQEQQDYSTGFICPTENSTFTKGSTCGVNIDGWNWDREYSLTITTKAPTTYNMKYTARIQMKSYLFSTDKAWSHYLLPYISVIVTDSTPVTYGRTCSSDSDPIIYTFDQYRLTALDAGEFLLYKNKRRAIEVHTIQKQMTKYGAAINCAVSVRAGPDIFIWYGCEGKWITRQLNCDKQKNLKVSATLSGIEYVIDLPTGGSVKASFNSYWDSYHHPEGGALNIYITPSVLDFNQTTGLCGNFNNVAADDFMDSSGTILSDTTAFSSSWRVKPEDSLFISKSRQSYAEEYYLCQCPTSERSLTADTTGSEPFVQGAHCSWRETFNVCHGEEFVPKDCQILTKRDVLEDDETINATPEIVIGSMAPASNGGWRNGWNETMATAYCKEYLDHSPIYAACKNIANVDPQRFLRDCVTNIELSGTRDWTESSFGSIRQSCLREVNMNATLWHRENSSATRSLAQTIRDVSCKNLCSGNGQCSNGICRCNVNFVGEDCSINMNMAPSVKELSYKGLCDTALYPCRTAFVYGGPFTSSDKLSCQFKEIEVNEAGVTKLEKVTNSSGDFENFNEVRCEIPIHSKLQRRRRSTNSFDPSSAVGFMISVSNNGQVYSPFLPVIIYDSSCTVCTISINLVHCSKKPNICISEGNCYPDTNPKCAVYSPKDDNNELDGHLRLIIGVICGIIGLALVIGVLLVFRHQFIKRSRVKVPEIYRAMPEVRNVHFKK